MIVSHVRLVLVINQDFVGLIFHTELSSLIEFLGLLTAEIGPILLFLLLSHHLVILILLDVLLSVLLLLEPIVLFIAIFLGIAVLLIVAHF